MVDLGQLETVAHDGEEVTRLSVVVESADLGRELRALTFDFVASDGYRSGSTPTCDGVIPMPGEILEQGYIHPVTRDLSWDENLDMPGCVQVYDTAQILASDP